MTNLWLVRFVATLTVLGERQQDTGVKEMNPVV